MSITVRESSRELTPRSEVDHLDLFAEGLTEDDLVLEELASNSALGCWGSAASFGSACGTAGTASSFSTNG